MGTFGQIKQRIAASDTGRKLGRKMMHVLEKAHGMDNAVHANEQSAKATLVTYYQQSTRANYGYARENINASEIEEALHNLETALTKNNFETLNKNSLLVKDRELLDAVHWLATKNDDNDSGLQEQAKKLLDLTYTRAAKPQNTRSGKNAIVNINEILNSITADEESGKQYKAVGQFIRSMKNDSKRGRLKENIDSAVDKLATGFHGELGKFAAAKFKANVAEFCTKTYEILDDPEYETGFKGSNPDGSVEFLNNAIADLFEVALVKDSSLSKLMVDLLRETSTEKRNNAVQEIAKYLMEHKNTKKDLKEKKENLIELRDRINIASASEESPLLWVDNQLLSQNQINNAISKTQSASLVHADKSLCKKIHDEIRKTEEEIDKVNIDFAEESRNIKKATEKIPKGFRDLLFKRLMAVGAEEHVLGLSGALHNMKNEDKGHETALQKALTKAKEQKSYHNEILRTSENNLQTSSTKISPNFTFVNDAMQDQSNFDNLKSLLTDLQKDGNNSAGKALERLSFNFEQVSDLANLMKEKSVANVDDSTKLSKAYELLFSTDEQAIKNLPQPIPRMREELLKSFDLVEVKALLAKTIERQSIIDGSIESPDFDKLDQRFNEKSINQNLNRQDVERWAKESNLYLSLKENINECIDSASAAASAVTNLDKAIKQQLEPKEHEEIIQKLYDSQLTDNVLQTFFVEAGLKANDAKEILIPARERHEQIFGEHPNEFQEFLLKSLEKIIEYIINLKR